MAKRRKITCNDCYFRQMGLCALSDGVPCPTFRPAKLRLAPPHQAPLVPREAIRDRVAVA
jgi:hypothetical protein